jgi:hypothetical protein
MACMVCIALNFYQLQDVGITQVCSWGVPMNVHKLSYVCSWGVLMEDAWQCSVLNVQGLKSGRVFCQSFVGH